MRRNFFSSISSTIGTINAIVIFIIFLINRQWLVLWYIFPCSIPLDMQQTNQSMHVWNHLTDNRGSLEILWSIVQLAYYFKKPRADPYAFKRPNALYCPDHCFIILKPELYGVCLFSFCICCNNKSNLLSLRPCSINIWIHEYWSCFIILSTLCFHSGSFKVMLQ